MNQFKFLAAAFASATFITLSGSASALPSHQCWVCSDGRVVLSDNVTVDAATFCKPSTWASSFTSTKVNNGYTCPTKGTKEVAAKANPLSPKMKTDGLENSSPPAIPEGFTRLSDGTLVRK